MPKRKMKQFLYNYYRGPSQAVTNSNKTEIYTSIITVSLKRKKNIYSANVLYLDTFNSGEELLLNIDVEVINNKHSNTSYIIGLVTPKVRDKTIWKELNAIKKQLQF